MRIKRFYGNITLLALFVLMASALIGVLIGLVMKNYLKYSEEITSYEKVMYLAKAGTELGLAIVNSRSPGLEYSLTSGNALTENFTCPYEVDEGEKCLYQPTFSLSISGLASELENCSNTPIQVGAGLSVIIPLFKDAGMTSVIEGLKGRKITPLEQGIKADYSTSSERKIGVLSFDDKNKVRDMNILTGLENIGNIKGENYLIIANTSDKNKELCLKHTSGIPQESVKIVSIGYFKDKQLGTETIAKKALPDFLKGDNYLGGKE